MLSVVIVALILLLIVSCLITLRHLVLKIKKEKLTPIVYTITQTYITTSSNGVLHYFIELTSEGEIITKEVSRDLFLNLHVDDTVFENLSNVSDVFNTLLN